MAENLIALCCKPVLLFMPQQDLQLIHFIQESQFLSENIPPFNLAFEIFSKALVITNA
jgi:hypothetical protein